jgi:glycosyltransferase involved in cell wall biosynthesis
MDPQWSRQLSRRPRRATSGGSDVRIAVYESLKPGGARRAVLETTKRLAKRHMVHLYRPRLFASPLFDAAPYVSDVYEYPYESASAVLDDRVVNELWFPESMTYFGPLKRLQQRVAVDMDLRGYDVVLVHTDPIMAAPFLLRQLRGRIPTVFYCQEPLRILREKRLNDEQRTRPAHRRAWPLHSADHRLALYRLQRNEVANAAAATTILVNSTYSRERIFAAYGRESTVCYLGVDSDVFHPVSSQLDDVVLSIGHASSLTKGHDLAVSALARIPIDERPTLRIIAPVPSTAQPSIARAMEVGVSLEVHSGRSDSLMAQEFSRAVATLCIARLEPFGLTALESMACGTPVIALNEAGYRETVRDGITGFLIDPDPMQLAYAIRNMRGHRAERRRLGSAAREHVLSWTWERCVSTIEENLEIAIREGRR